MREVQDLQQVEYLMAVWGGTDMECFFLIIFFRLRVFLISLFAFVIWRVDARYFCRLEVAFPSSTRLKPYAIRSRLQTSLKRKDVLAKKQVFGDAALFHSRDIALSAHTSRDHHNVHAC